MSGFSTNAALSVNVARASVAETPTINAERSRAQKTLRR